MNIKRNRVRVNSRAYGKGTGADGAMGRTVGRKWRTSKASIFAGAAVQQVRLDDGTLHILKVTSFKVIKDQGGVK